MEIQKEDNDVSQWIKCYRSLDAARHSVEENIRENWKELNFLRISDHSLIAYGPQKITVIEAHIQEAELRD